MSPIPSVVTAFALSPTAPSVALDTDSPGQLHLLGTGGLLFAVVAIVSVAGYFYHGRAVASGAKTSSAWASLTSFLSSMRYRGPATNSTTAATDWFVDLEVGPEKHVSMVYARFFHPTFWNLIECHPATPSAPAIYVEDEANEIPVSEPKSPGMNSFLDMDDEDGDGDSVNLARKKADQVGRPRGQELPPYDTSSLTNVNFSSEIIGTTVRPGTFLSVPGELEDDPPESLEPKPELESELEFPCSPYDGISTTDSESDFSCSPYDGISTTDSEPEFSCSPYDGISTTDSEPEFFCSPYDGILTTPSSSSSRYGVADVAYLARNPKDTTPEEGYPLVHTISRRAGLLDLSEFVEADQTLPREILERLEPMDTKPTIPNGDIGVHVSHNGLGNGLSNAGAVAASQEGLDLMRRLLKELRDPNLDCTPRALSEDSYSECCEDDDDPDEDEATIPRLAPPWLRDNVRRNSLELTFTPGTDSDMSDEGPIYPPTPPPDPATSLASAPDVHQDRMASLVAPWFNKEVTIMPPTSSDSPPLLPTNPYIRTHRNSRSLLYGP